MSSLRCQRCWKLQLDHLLTQNWMFDLPAISETLLRALVHIMVSHGLRESWLGRRRESLRIHGQPTSADVGDSCYFLGSADVSRKRRRISTISGVLRVRKWASTEIINSLRSPTLVVYNISEIGTLFRR